MQLFSPNNLPSRRKCASSERPHFEEMLPCDQMRLSKTIKRTIPPNWYTARASLQKTLHFSMGRLPLTSITSAAGGENQSTIIKAAQVITAQSITRNTIAYSGLPALPRKRSAGRNWRTMPHNSWRSFHDHFARALSLTRCIV